MSNIMSDFPEDLVDEPTTSFTPINGIKNEPTSEEVALGDIKPVKTEPDDEETPTTPTVTPRKRGKKAQNGSTAAGGDTPSKKPKNGGTPKTTIGPIPTSLESAGMADKLILRMRDEEGKSWPDITAAWSTLTGIQVGKSALPMRYQIMKANFVSVGEDDEARLLQAKKEVEDKFESEKWRKIAEVIEANGGSKYPAATLVKKFKELNKKNNTSAVVIKDED